MRALSEAALLEAWEAGWAKTPAERALDLLTVVCPETSRDRLTALSIGQRDAMLLHLRERLCGSVLAAVVVCPDCNQRLELTFDMQQLRSVPQEPEAEVEVNVDGYDLRFRPVNTGDAAALAGQSSVLQEDPEYGRNLLLQRCLLSANHCGVAIEPERIPSEVVEMVTQRMAEADPMAEIQMAMACPSCTRRWSATLDITSFLWTEIEVWAWRLLNDIHTLALAYGWSERDILSMSATRRQLYLRMVWA